MAGRGQCGCRPAPELVKPFSPTELAARIRAALRKRAAPELAQPSEPYVRGDLTVDYPRRRVTVAGNPVELTAIEYRMLVELSVNAGRALTHEHLLQRVWGPDKGEDSGPVRNIVKRLRRKLGEDASNPAFIFAEPRVGYRMEKGEEQEGDDARPVLPSRKSSGDNTGCTDLAAHDGNGRASNPGGSKARGA